MGGEEERWEAQSASVIKEGLKSERAIEKNRLSERDGTKNSDSLLKSLVLVQPIQ